MTFEDWWDKPEGCGSTPDTYKGWESSCREAWKAGQLEFQQQLAAEQAYSALLLESLEDVGVTFTDKARSIPRDDSALREWGARLLRKLAKDVPYVDSGDLFVKADELVSGDWKP